MNLSSTPELLREKIVLSKEKLEDINSLLVNRFGENWRELDNLEYFVKFYEKKGASKVVSGRKLKQGDTVVDDIDYEYCTCCEEDEPTYLQ